MTLRVVPLQRINAFQPVKYTKGREKYLMIFVSFRPIFNEVLFVEMKPQDRMYEPLVGYIVLEQSQAAVDMLGHRLIRVKRKDLK